MKFFGLFLYLFVVIDAEIIEFNLNDGPVRFDLSEQQNLEAETEAPAKDKTSTQKLDFEKPYYTVNVEKSKLKKGYKPPFNVQMNQEITKGDFKLTDVQKYGMEEYFTVSSLDKIKISVDLNSDIALANLEDKNQLIFLLEFIPENKDDTVRTMLIMFLQDTPSEKPEKIIFDKSNYKINAVAEHIGMVGEFIAKLDKNDGKSVIKYNLETNDNLKNSLKLNELTGALEIIKALAPGSYNFKISAKIDSGIHSEADVTLVIDHIAVCDPTHAKFQYSQLIKHIAEGKTGDILSAATPTDKCVYKIVSQDPAGDYFKLDEKTGALQMAKGIKRNDVLFKDSDSPKFVIKLAVNCDSATKVEEIKNHDLSTESGSNLPYNPVQMVLIVVIDKAEDTPIFNTDKIVVGYPRKYDIITQYGPARVTSVAPFVGDKDTSSLKYSIVEENSPFSIHPNFGDVYPLSYVNKDEEYSFTVLAEDIVGIKDGEPISKQGKLSVSVKLLTVPQIVEIFFIGQTWKDVDKLLQDYTSNLDIEIKPLVYAVVPITNEQRQSNKVLKDEKQIHLLRALCYALDKKEHSVVKGEIIVDKLKTSSSVFSVQILENKRAPDSKGHGSNSSFIVTTSIFSVILALGVIVTLFYIVYMRRRNVPVIIMRRNGNDRSSVTALEDDMEAPSRTRWIGPEENFYNRFDQRNTNAFSNPTFQRTQRVEYSDTRGAGEIIIMQNNSNSQSRTNDFLTSGVSSFKPSSTDAIFSPDNTTDHDHRNVYRDLEFPPNGNAESLSGSSNIPVLHVTSLPPVSEQQWRKKTNTDDGKDE